MSVNNYEEIIEQIVYEFKKSNTLKNFDYNKIKKIVSEKVNENKELNYNMLIKKLRESITINLLEKQYLNIRKECEELKNLAKILHDLNLNNNNILEYFTDENIQILSQAINTRIDSQYQVDEKNTKITKKIDKNSDLHSEMLTLTNSKKEIHYLYELERLIDFISQTPNPLNQLYRIQYNIANYNTFICLMLRFFTKKKKYTDKIREYVDEFRLSMSAFILNMQFDNLVINIDNAYFSEEVRHSLHYISKSNDVNVSINKIIRNAISHGEYYLHNKNGKKYIKIENSGRKGKFLELEISYDEFIKYIKDNYLEEFNANYPNFLLLSSILKENVVKENSIKKNEFIMSLITLNAFNIIEYNTQHHFKEIKYLNKFVDISNFIFKCSEKSKYFEREITVYELLENIKNAIGHGNINYNDETEEIEFNNINPHKNPPEWVSSTKITLNDLIRFFSNSSLYNISTMTNSRTNYNVFRN